jgi:hypothetical protein
MLKYSTACAVVLGLLLSSSPLRAQEARADQGSQPATIESSADQAVTPAPAQATDQPTRIEKIRLYVEKKKIVQRLSGDGFYPRIGGLSSGSGFAGGGGYRRHVGWLYADVSAAASMKSYLGFDAKVRWLQTANETLEVWTDFKYRDNTQDDFYGLGPGSTNDTRVNYGIRSNDVVARIVGRPRPWFRVGADVGYLSPELRRGRDTTLRSIEQIFTESTAPGLAQQPNFVHDSVFAEVDSRDVKGFPRRGGLYRATYALWDDRTFNQYDFRRFDVQGSQFIGLSANDVIALRVSLSYANNQPGDVVPFYLLPYIGGGDSVRAYREFRFRDENTGYLNAEYRRRVHKMVHVAGFIDAGKVAHDWQDIDVRNLKRAYGFGVRAGNDKRVFARFDVAFGGGEGTRFFLKFSPSF